MEKHIRSCNGMSKVFVALHSTSHEESNTKYSNDRLFAFSSVLYQRQARTDAAAVDAFVSTAQRCSSV